MSKDLNGYDLSRAWFDFCFENPEKIKPNHTALYFFAIENCNRLGWKKVFGLPTTMAMEAIGIRSYNTYKNTLNDLVEWKFIMMVEVSKNQFSSNKIALSDFNKALDKALDKALIKHGSKQSESTVQSIDSVDKPITSKQLTINKELEGVFFPFDSRKFKDQWILWKDYKKKEFGFKYKSIQSEQAALISISKLSNQDEKMAIAIINQSFENGWKGFFKLTTQQNGQKTGTNPTDDELAEALRNQGFNNG